MALTGYPKTFKSTSIHYIDHTTDKGTANIGDVLGGNNTYFKVKAFGQDSSVMTTIIVRYTEGGTPRTINIFAGQSLEGPFAEIEIDAIGHSSGSAMVYYQEI